MKSHETHEVLDSLAVVDLPELLQFVLNPPRTQERLLEVQFVEKPHDDEVGIIDLVPTFVINTRARDCEQCALARQRRRHERPALALSASPGLQFPP